jgi:hypothetical protein
MNFSARKILKAEFISVKSFLPFNQLAGEAKDAVIVTGKIIIQ